MGPYPVRYAAFQYADGTFFGLASALELVGVEASFGSGSADLGDPRHMYGPAEAAVACLPG